MVTKKSEENMLDGRTQYYVYVELGEEIEQEDILEGLEKFNNRNGFLFFDKVMNDGRLRYILFVRNAKSSLMEMTERLTELFETDVLISPVDMEVLSLDEKQQLKVARRARAASSIDGEKRCRWKTQNTEQIEESLSQMNGFTDFKEGLRKLQRYCKHIRQTGAKGLYNVVLVNHCEVETEPFCNYIFDVLANAGVIRDYYIAEGELWDAANTSRNTPFLYCIFDDWATESGFRFMHRSPTGALKKIRKKNPIYLANMSHQEYEEMRRDKDFVTFFPHVIELNELSPAEKLNFLIQEAASSGFQIVAEEFTGSDLLDLSMPVLKQMLAQCIYRKLSNNEELLLELHCVDFELPCTSRGDVDLDDAASDKENDPLQELESLVGLGEVKQKVREIKAFLERRGKDSLPCLHMVFRGNPGTGKTTVARLLGKIFADIGVTKNREIFVETDREGLIALYVGHTAMKTAARIREAQGGVLFIDEAYSLGIYGSERDFGAEAIATLVKRMEDWRKEFVCIMAGYTEEMDKMLKVNPGLRDRIQFYIDFPDYAQEELVQIFRNICTAQGYLLSLEAEQMITKYMEKIVANKDTNFANARLVRKIFERVQVQQAMRTEDMAIEAADIEQVFAEGDLARIIAPRKTRSVGFAA
ncbi:AAA family ATPase [Synergistaceae bacterium OttesenSCG-928-D05]|nr:AAA family ATPase [Synergistaceae bacterium OttesenSCG-928-D05]